MSPDVVSILSVGGPTALLTESTFASAGLADRLRLLDRGEALTLPFP